MFTFLTIVHVLVCLFLIVVVLLQSGKAADLAGAFGGMGSQTAFGPRGSATLLSKATTISAIIFMMTSLALSIMATRMAGSGPATGSVLDKAPATAPETPGTTTTLPSPVPGGAPPTAPATGKKQPSVTLTDEATGAKRTIPLNIPPTGGQQPAQKNQAPAQTPAKK